MEIERDSERGGEKEWGERERERERVGEERERELRGVEEKDKHRGKNGEKENVEHWAIYDHPSSYLSYLSTEYRAIKESSHFSTLVV